MPNMAYSRQEAKGGEVLSQYMTKWVKRKGGEGVQLIRMGKTTKANIVAHVHSISPIGEGVLGKRESAGVQGRWATPDSMLKDGEDGPMLQNEVQRNANGSGIV